MNTTITIKKETYQRLRSFGKMGQTFDELINELLTEILQEKRSLNE